MDAFDFSAVVKNLQVLQDVRRDHQWDKEMPSARFGNSRLPSFLNCLVIQSWGWCHGYKVVLVEEKILHILCFWWECLHTLGERLCLVYTLTLPDDLFQNGECCGCFLQPVEQLLKSIWLTGRNEVRGSGILDVWRDGFTCNDRQVSLGLIMFYRFRNDTDALKHVWRLQGRRGSQFALRGRRASLFVFVICKVVAVSPADGFTSVAAAVVSSSNCSCVGSVCVCVVCVCCVCVWCSSLPNMCCCSFHIFLKIKAY